METYEEVMRRNEPKNYTVRWRMADGTTEQAQYFPSFAEAEIFSLDLKMRDYVTSVDILRAGRHPSAKKWLSSERRRPVVNKRNTSLLVNEDAWMLPAGFVDGDADKHGPTVMPELDNRLPARSNTEKIEWAHNHPQDSGLLGFRAI